MKVSYDMIKWLDESPPKNKMSREVIASDDSAILISLGGISCLSHPHPVAMPGGFFA